MEETEKQHISKPARNILIAVVKSKALSPKTMMEIGIYDALL